MSMTDSKTGTATFVRVLTGWNGDARLYRLDPPVKFDDYGDSAGDKSTEHVIVSAVVAPFSGPETYIFPSGPDGEVRDFGELNGSYQGGLDHVEALRGAGYEVKS